MLKTTKKAYAGSLATNSVDPRKVHPLALFVSYFNTTNTPINQWE